MEIVDFVESKRPRWLDLERLLDKAEGSGLPSLGLDEVRLLSKAYRGASADLLWVRARGGAAEVTEYLNDLVGRAYALTYPGQKLRAADVRQFLLRGFPAVLRREWRPLLASLLLTVCGYGFGWGGMRADKDARHYLVPEEHLKIDPIKRAHEQADGTVATVQEQVAFSSFLFTHNIQVAFLAFALGLTVGVGTAVLLFVNGLFLGALAALYAEKAMTGWFWAWILPHGIPELTAIIIAGAAGFVLARALAAPGGLSRRAALRKESGTALQLVLGTLLLFVLAGIIEGTISQIHPPKLSIAFKVGFALVVGSGVYAYLLSGFFTPRLATTERRAP